jgi:integrase
MSVHDSGAGAPTVGEWLEEWLATVRLEHPRTAPTYSYWIRHLSPLYDIHLHDLTPSDCLHLFADGLPSHLAPTSRRHVWSVLHAALTAARQRGLIDHHPLRDLHGPRGNDMERPILSIEECQRLLNVAHDDRLGALVVLAIYTGAREGELLALTWRDIDLETARLRITKSLGELPAGGLGERPTKTRAGRRSLSLPPEAVMALVRHKAQQDIERLGAPRWEDHDLVFTTTIGTPIRRSNLITRWWHPLLSRAGLPSIHFHDLRHTAAHLMMSNSPLTTVSRRLGHSSTRVTSEFYGHSTRVDDYELSDALQSVLRPRTTAEPIARPAS